jgi:hypothetical protein
VHHRIELPVRKNLRQQGQISQVTLNETAMQHSITVPAAEVVQRGDLRTRISQQRPYLGAYKTSCGQNSRGDRFDHGLQRRVSKRVMSSSCPCWRP